MSDVGFQAAEASRRLDLVVMDGEIESVDYVAARVRVRIEDELITDDLPWVESFGGRFRSWSPPKVGEPVVVLCPSGEPTQGRVLRGVDSDAFARSSDRVDLLALFQDSEDQDAHDTYDAATQTRSISVPPGGKVVVEVADGGTVEISHQLILVKADTVTVEAGTATIKAANLLLGPDGNRQPVARKGDPVVNGVISAGSPSVKSS